MGSPYYDLQNANRIFGNEKDLFRFVKDLLNQNFKIYEVKQTSGDIVPYHTHSHKEVIIILEGRVRMIIEEEMIDLQKGDILTINPWSIHLACFPFVDEPAHFYLCFPKK